MKAIYKILSLLMLAIFFSNCNDSDDVAAIFTGKTWKLNFIAKDGDNRMYNFWDSEESKAKSLKLLQSSNTFTIKFGGQVEGDLIQGQVNGTTVTSSFEGGWSANAKNHSFQTNIKGNDDSDVLAKNFLEGLKAASSYEGDANNLYIIYKTQAGTFRMFFRVMNK